MRNARNRVIKMAVWEIRYNTRLTFFDRAGSLMQRFLDWEGRRFFPRWSYSVDGIELSNPETFTKFTVGVKRASAAADNLLPIEDYGRFSEKALEFFHQTVQDLGLEALGRVGHRLAYLVPTDETFEAFAQALTSQLTRLPQLADNIEACRAEDVSAVWISKHEGTSFRWAVGPLALEEFPGRFAAHELPPEANKEERRFYPAVSLLVEVDAFRTGQVPAAELDGFWRDGYDYIDQQVLKLTHALQEKS